MSDAALALDNIVRTYHPAGHSLEVLRGATLSIGRGELVALVGPSGAGKSTLLHIAGLLERPDSGDIVIDATNVVRPRMSSSMASWIRISASESTIEVASSRISIRRSTRPARAIEIRCRCPPDSFTPRSPISVS